ncbi:cytochrome P450 9G3 [Bombyx mori]|uniref:unspecific monooxygenase n=3 Tax=Bombyx mori TaxID=7091 RepID=B1AAB3_BOMMO|nr:cytochrome P450 9G3 [Bombyx mori]ABZ81070.1 CYP9G3 [Bombyx mori]BAM73894.1 cytochrome P450 [Bombyx mori]BAM73895.1 cytochrome P450 [Bombyx mori]
MLVEVIVFLITTLVAYYLYVYKKIHYFYDARGVKYQPGIPVLGNILKSSLGTGHFWEDIDKIYKAFPGERYIGYIEGTTPILMIKDPEIIKNITVRDFDHFVNHKEFFPVEIDALFGGSLFMMKDDKWRDMRTTLSPAFTGSKMRLMLPFMIDISKNIVEYLKGHQLEDVDVDDLMRRYTNDVIASAGFGLQVNSLVDKDNEFYECGQAMFSTSWPQRFKMILAAQFPTLAKKIGIKVFPQKVTRFFREIVTSTMDYRLKNNVERPDMIQLLMDAYKGTLKNESNESDEKNVGFAMTEEMLKPKGNVRKWTQDELTAQVFIFFLAGFESSANGLTLCIHELALNPEAQEKLYEAIIKFKEEKGPLTYDNIGELKYLDCVLNETSRKWSAAIIVDRVCSKPYELPPPREGGKPYKLQPGDIVYNSVNSIQMDPEHHPDPEKFDPDRFLDENKHKIKPFTFLPFGAGPRNCIGSRFALLELKVLIYYIVLNFKIIKTEKTLSPIKLQPGEFNIKVLGGTWTQFEARE